MNSIIKPSQSALEMVDLEQALQQGRRLRSQAFTSFMKALFTSSKDEHSLRAVRVERQGAFSPDCAATA